MVKFTKEQSKGMNDMIVENKKIDKACSFYVSDFHLEMILMPYINEKIDKRENIVITTEKDLRDTVEILISKVNINKENKKKILDLGWGKSGYTPVNDESNVIVIGTEKYINDINNKIEDSNINKVTIINCYDFEEVKDNIVNIVEAHDESLNTIGFDKI